MNSCCLYREWKENMGAIAGMELALAQTRSHSETLFGDLIARQCGRLTRVEVTFEGSAGETADMILLSPPFAGYFFHQGRFYRTMKEDFSCRPPIIVVPLTEDETKKLMNDQSFVRSITGSDT